MEREITNRELVARCGHPGVIPMLTEDQRYVEAERCTGCPATWWFNIPDYATDEDRRQYAAWLKQEEDAEAKSSS